MIETKPPASRPSRLRRRPSLVRWQGLVFLGVLALATSGCGHLFRSSPPKAKVGSLEPTAGEQVPLAVLQIEVMRFADSYAWLEAQAADDFVARAARPQARMAGVKWKLGQATAAFNDATGPSAVLNTLDLVILATASRMVVEDHGVEMFGEAVSPIIETQRRLETNAWGLARRALKPDQEKELMRMIEAWRRQNPDQRYVGAIRFRELAAAVGKAQQVATPPPSSIFSLLFINPLSGMDPTATAIQETRELAERAMYYSQRMPTLLNWQVQLLSLQLASEPETKQILSDAERLTRSTEAFAQVADQLPKLINEQREAAIRQVLDGVASERTNLLAGLAAEEQKARALLAETRQTLDAGSGMAVSVQAAVKALDEFVRSVAPPTNRAAADTTNKPFNVLDYGQAAGQIGTMAQDLHALLAGLNQTTPELARLRRDTATEIEGVLHRAFWLGLALSLIVLVGAVAAGLAYRALSTRLWRDPFLPVGPQFQRGTSK